LANEVYVSVSGLERLGASLSQTLPMLDRFVSANALDAKATLQKIDLTLDDYSSRMSHAYQNYQRAVADLQYAQQNSEDGVPDFYYAAAVYSTEAEYNRLTNCCNRIRNIRANFCEQNDRLQRAIAEDAETYLIACKKGIAFIENYIGVLNRSNSALSNGG
jgi:hypothetical protein